MHYLNTYWKWDNVIPEHICDDIIARVDWQNAKQAGTEATKEGETFDIRSTTVAWEDPMSVVGCIAQSYIRYANRAANWHMDIIDIERVQIARYSERDYYGWHIDMLTNGAMTTRKLSTSIVLNNDFEGGELEFEGVKEQPKMGKGSVIVFPSFVRHQVKPVTKGVRYSAVAWMHGPAFK